MENRIDKRARQEPSRRKTAALWASLMAAVVANALTVQRNERGEINIGGVLMLGIGMVFLAVGFIMYPIVMTATDDILTYQYTANTSITDATYTGLTQITGIVPLLVLVGFVAQSVVAGMMGVQIMRGTKEAKFGPGSLMMSGLGIVFIAIGLIIFPVVLDGISSVVSNGGAGLSSSYTGLSGILLVVPMIVELGYIAASVITGFFGIKNLASAG